MQQALQGDLFAFGLPDLLNLLHRGRRTGVLVLESDEAETKIFVEEGRPVSANTTKSEFRLGAVLERQGKVQPSRIRDAWWTPATSARRLGQRLLASGEMSEADLLAALKVQVSSIMFDAFSWKEGGFAFYDGVGVPLKAVRIDLDFHSLLIEGVRRLPDPATTTAAEGGRRALEALINAERLKQAVALTEEEWRVLFLVDGRRTVEDVCRLADLGDADQALRIVERMIQARFLRLGARRAPEEPGVVAIEVAGKGTGTRELPGSTPGASEPGVGEAAVALGSGGALEPVQDDDRRHVVGADARAYVERVKKVTVSRLIVQSTVGPTSSLPLTRDSYAIGRHRTNDIVITDPKVSGFHARLDHTSEGFAISDLKSRNGTWVNGKRVERAVLVNGDEIGVGSARLQYRVDYESEP